MKLTKNINEIESIKEELHDLIENFEETQRVIEDRALELDREMTDKEQERYDALEEHIDAINSCIVSLDDAQSIMTDYE